MKKVLFLLIAIVFSKGIAYSQKASDILEGGIVVKGEKNLNIQFINAGTDNIIKYDVKETSKKGFISLDDSLYFLAMRSAVNVFMKPINPLNFSISGEVTFSPDKIDQNAGSALTAIITLLDKINSKGAVESQAIKKDVPTSNIDDIRTIIKRINDSLSHDNKALVAKSFNALKLIDFADDKVTLTRIDEQNKIIISMKSYLDNIANGITNLKNVVSAYEKDNAVDAISFVYAYIFGHTITDIQSIYNVQLKRYNNLLQAYTLVKNAADAAGTDWIVFLKEVRVSKGEVSNFALTVNKDGYELSSDSEIIKSTKKSIVARTLFFRRFQLFVPEVAAGTAYTYLTFPKFW